MNDFKQLFSFLIVLSLASCNFSAQEYVKTTEEKFQQSEQENEEGQWIMELANKTPLTENEFLALLPKKLYGMPLRSSAPDQLNSVRGTYSKDYDPDHSSISVSLVIVEGSGDTGFQHINYMFKLLQNDAYEDTKDGWGKITSHKGLRVLVKEKALKGLGSIPARQLSEVEFIKNNRFHILLQGNNMESTTLLKVAEEVQELSFPK